jgi:hypothetical protein
MKQDLPIENCFASKANLARWQHELQRMGTFFSEGLQLDGPADAVSLR